jgi:HSP20 family protein
MADRKQALAPSRSVGDPFSMLRQMTSELERAFDFPSFRWPAFVRGSADAPAWSPKIDVFEKNQRLVTRVDLPGVTKDDVSVEVVDGHLALSGERRREVEETKESYYRIEREYGRFYRAIPLPEGVKFDDIKATFADGVLEVSVPLPPKQAGAVKVPIEGARKTAA